jgi:hypothetical protein
MVLSIIIFIIDHIRKKDLKQTYSPYTHNRAGWLLGLVVTVWGRQFAA